MNWLQSKEYGINNWHNLDPNVYKRIQKIFLKMEVDEFRVQELALLQLEIPYDQDFLGDVIGYFRDESFRFQLENFGKTNLIKVFESKKN